MCKPSPAPIVKGDRFGKFQCPRNQYDIDQMKAVLYASAVGSQQYAQVCTRPDLVFFTRILGRYQSNPGQAHWIMVKKALRYVQGSKGLILTIEVWHPRDRRVLRCRFCGRHRWSEVHIRLSFYSRRRSYIMEKLQAKCHCIINDVFRICCMLWGLGACDSWIIKGPRLKNYFRIVKWMIAVVSINN